MRKLLNLWGDWLFMEYRIVLQPLEQLPGLEDLIFIHKAFKKESQEQAHQAP